MSGCTLHDHFAALLGLMGTEDTFTLSRESLTRLLEQHAPANCGSDPARPDSSPATSSMGYTTEEIAARMKVSPATAGRYIRAGWFGDPKGLKPNGSHYRIPHQVAEDVWANGPIGDRVQGAPSTAPKRVSSSGHSTPQSEVPGEPRVEREVRLDPSGVGEPPPEDGASTQAREQAAVVASAGSRHDGTDIKGRVERLKAAQEEPVHPMLAALGDWEEVFERR